MAKRISFYQIPITPGHIVDGLNRGLEDDDPGRVDATRTLDIPDSATLYPLGWDHQSAANPAAGTGILNLLVIESVVSSGGPGE